MRTVAIAILCIFALVACKSAKKWESNGAKAGPSSGKTMVEPAMAEPAMAEPVMKEPAMAAEAMKEPAMAAEAMKEPAMAADAMKAPAMKADAMKAPAMKADAMKASMGPPKRPKSHAKGHKKCLTCHKVGGGVKAMPKNHKGRSQGSCKACHRQSK